MERSKEESRPYAVACWVLSAAFAARVLGQALQSTLALPFLPAAGSFQGSSIPYPILLAIQLAILWGMLRYTLRLHHGALAVSRRAGGWWAAAGGAYMVVALGRIGIGVAVPDSPAWFSAWIPAAFHVVLAAFVLTVAAYHLLRSRGERGA